jgi:thiol-disulfide isomerase/thioredoxin
MKKLKYCLLAILCPILCWSQPTVKPLSIGDTVPDIAFTHLINSNSHAGKSISDLKGKLVILDFWATWCGACLGQFSKLEGLQKQFGQRIQVLLVNSALTGDKDEQVKAFFLKRKKPDGQSYNIPTLVGDSVFTRLFPHKLIPHYVWVKDGIVTAITGSHEVSASSISAMLKGEKPALLQKNDALAFDRNKSLLSNDVGAAEKMLFHSFISGHIDGLPSCSGYSIDAAKGQKRVYFINMPLLSIYQAIIGKAFTNRILLEIDHPDDFWPMAANPEDRRNQLFCYELSFPISTLTTTSNNLMLQDLDRYFGLHGRMEERMMHCLALVLLPEMCKRFTDIQATAIVPQPSLHQETIRISNQPLKVLVKELNKPKPGRPLPIIILDETGFTGNVNLVMNGPLENTHAITRELKYYGLTLRPVERRLEVFVLSDAHEHHSY